MNIYHLLFYFFIYSFIGWCTEVAYAGFKEKQFVNRGFLNGPLCPIYGVGIVAVVMITSPFEKKMVLLYIVSAMVVTLIELVTGFLMDKLFHHKWWDYKDLPLNIGGYVCLPFSLIWGFACLFVIKIMHPVFVHFVNWMPHTLGLMLLIVLMVELLADVTVTYVEVGKLNKQLDAMEKVAHEMHQISDRIGINIFEKVTETMELQDKLAEASEEQREKVHDLISRYKSSMKTSRLSTRMIKAFPSMESRLHKDALEKLKEKLKRN